MLKRTAERALCALLAQHQKGSRRKPPLPLGLIEPPAGISGRGCCGRSARPEQQTSPQGVEGKASGELPQKIAAPQRPTIT
jgi:hypothetical protein